MDLEQFRTKISAELYDKYRLENNLIDPARQRLEDSNSIDLVPFGAFPYDSTRKPKVKE